MTYRFYLTVTPFHATVACDSRSPPSSVRSALTLSPARPRRSPLADPARCGAPPSPATTHYPPPATHCLFVCPLFSHTYKSLGGQPLYFHIHTNPRECTLCGPQCSDLRAPCVALFLQLFCPQVVAASFSLFALFSASFSLFSTSYSLFFKIPGVWVSRTVLRGGGRRNSALLTTHYPLSSAYPTACMEETSSGISMRILDNSVRASSSGGSFSWGTYSSPIKKS